MKTPYTYVKRASKADKKEMQDIVDSLNELAPESEEITGIVMQYSLKKIKDSYIVECHSTDGQLSDSGCFVRCSNCGAIRELFDGQIEFCTECWQDW